MKMYIALDRDEIQAQIPYALVATTMSSAIWQTSRRRRLMRERFTESEIEATYRLHQQAYNWYLRKGVPDEVQMTLNTYNLWQRLARFCYEL